jgi:hypothetical protein
VKCLLLHCRSFAYELGVPTISARPSGETTRRFSDSLVVFTAFEPGDVRQINTAARAIRRHARKVDASAIVVNPFVHLTNTPAPPEEAAGLARALHSRLVSTYERPVGYGGFGWQKSFALDVYGGALSHAYREFRSDTQCRLQRDSGPVVRASAVGADAVTRENDRSLPPPLPAFPC